MQGWCREIPAPYPNAAIFGGQRGPFVRLLQCCLLGNSVGYVLGGAYHPHRLAVFTLH